MRKASTKYKPHYVYSSLIETVARVRAHGIEKYGGEECWREDDPMEHLDACRRHLDACIEALRKNELDKLVDPDSGELHYAHAVANLMFEIERFYDKKEEGKKKK
jgi:hypothetical protein